MGYESKPNYLLLISLLVLFVSQAQIISAATNSSANAPQTSTYSIPPTIQGNISVYTANLLILPPRITNISKYNVLGNVSIFPLNSSSQILPIPIYLNYPCNVPLSSTAPYISKNNSWYIVSNSTVNQNLCYFKFSIPNARTNISLITAKPSPPINPASYIPYELAAAVILAAALLLYRSRHGAKGFRRRTRGFKLQSSIEYVMIFAISLVILAIVVSVISGIFYNNKVSTYTPSSCFITAQIKCLQLAITNNGIKSTAVLEVENIQSIPISLTQNALKVVPTSSQRQFIGSCYPSNIVPGGTATCIANLSGFSQSIGTQLEPSFQISFTQCYSGACARFNTTGTSNLYVSPPINLFRLTLLTTPSSGKITLNGIQYPNGTILYFTKGTNYSVHADPPTQYAFQQWVASGGASVKANVQSTVSYQISNGTLLAVFNTIKPITLSNVSCRASCTSGLVGGYTWICSGSSPSCNNSTAYSCTSGTSSNQGGSCISLAPANYILTLNLAGNSQNEQVCYSIRSSTSQPVNWIACTCGGAYTCVSSSLQTTAAVGAIVDFERTVCNPNCPGPNPNPSQNAWIGWSCTEAPSGQSCGTADQVIMPSSNVVETATWQAPPTQWCVTTQPSPSNGGTTSPSTQSCANFNVPQTLTATASSGYTFSSWSGLPSGCSYTSGSSSTGSGTSSSSVSITCSSSQTFTMTGTFTATSCQTTGTCTTSCNAGCLSGYSGSDYWTCQGSSPSCGPSTPGASASCSSGSVTSYINTCTQSPSTITCYPSCPSGYTASGSWTCTGPNPICNPSVINQCLSGTRGSQTASCNPSPPPVTYPWTLCIYVQSGSASTSPINSGCTSESSYSGIPVSATTSSGYTWNYWTAVGCASLSTSYQPSPGKSGTASGTVSCSTTGGTGYIYVYTQQVPTYYVTLNCNPYNACTDMYVSVNGGPRTYALNSPVSANPGQSVCMTEEPLSGFGFLSWGGGSYSGGANPTGVDSETVACFTMPSSSVTETANYQAQAPLTCYINPSSTSITAGQSVTYTATISGGSGSLSGCSWSMPCTDGATNCYPSGCYGSSSTLTATFGNAGTFGGYSTFTDTAGHSTQCYASINVAAPAPPCYSFSILPGQNAGGYIESLSNNGNCPYRAGPWYTAGTPLYVTVTPGSGNQQISPCPAFGLYSLSGTYSLCSLTTGTSSSTYLITMNQNTQEVANFAQRPAGPQPGCYYQYQVSAYQCYLGTGVTGGGNGWADCCIINGQSTNYMYETYVCNPQECGYPNCPPPPYWVQCGGDGYSSDGPDYGCVGYTVC